MVGLGRWRAAAAVALVMAGVVTSEGAAAAGAEPAPITVTRLIGPDERPMTSAGHINDHGVITGEVYVPPEGFYDPHRAVVWQRGTATFLGVGIGTKVVDVSEHGQVVGTTAIAIASAGFSWSDGVYTTLADEPPGSDPNEPRPFFIRADAVNERGQVLGIRLDPTREVLVAETAVWEDGEVTASTGWVADMYQVPNPRDINDRGQAVVNVGGPVSDDGESIAAIWRVGGRITELGTLGGAQSWGEAIDQRGRVAGISETATGQSHAFLWQRGEMIDLGTLGGATSGVGEFQPTTSSGKADDALNDRGEVVGTSETAAGTRHAFLWRRGRMIDLGTLGGATSEAVALNNRGQVVGISETAAGEEHAFLWQRGEMIDLGALGGSGQSRANDINDRGQIVGTVGGAGVLWTAPPGG